MKLELSGRRAIVTGAAQGIGRSIVQALHDEGVQVAAFDIDAAGLTNATQAGAVLTHTVDLADRTAVQAAVQHTADMLGGIDILVNCAGGVRGQVGRPLEDVGEQDWMVLFEANVHGAFWCSQAVAPHMKRGGYGRIVNIASGAGLRPLGDASAYCVTKAGLIMFGKALAIDLAPAGIRVNAVCPGVIETPMSAQALALPGVADMMEKMTPLGRTGKPREIASAVLWLCSEESSFVTGHPLVIDGGVTVQ